MLEPAIVAEHDTRTDHAIGTDFTAGTDVRAGGPQWAIRKTRQKGT